MPLSQESQSRSLSLAKRYVPLAAALLVIIGGSLSIAGWVNNNPRFIDWFASGITIKFNTSVCITLAALALLAAAISPKLKVLSCLLAAVPIIVGLISLVQHAFRVDLGMDTLFYTDFPGSPPTPTPGRIGVPAAISLVLVGLGLIILNKPTLRRWASLLGMIVTSLSAVSLIGYLYGAEQLYTRASLTGIAIQTAIMLAILGIGVIAVVPERGLAEIFFRNDAGGDTFRRLCFSIILVLLLGGWLRVLAYNIGFLDSSLGGALRTLLEIGALLALLWLAANSVSRAESRRIETEKARDEVEIHRRISAVQEAERRRLSRDLHDHTGQQLTGLRLKLENARAQAEKTDTKLAADIESACGDASRLDSDISLLAWELRPATLDSLGLEDALRSFVREWSATHGIKAEFHMTQGDVRMRPEIETNLYRIAQEALNNTLKYASATEVAVTLDCSGDQATMIVEDNGVGFNIDELGLEHVTASGGLGLVGMQERAALLGGSVEIESSPDGGTSVYARVPATC